MLLCKQQDVTVQVSCWNFPVGSRFTFIHPWAGLSFPQLYNHLELNWSNQTQGFKTHTDAFSPSVRQLTYVGNRLLHFWLLSQIHVLKCFSLCCRFSGPITAHPHPLESFQLTPACRPATFWNLWNPGQPSTLFSSPGATPSPLRATPTPPAM